MNVFGINVLRPRKTQCLEIAAHPAFVVLKFGRSSGPGSCVLGDINPAPFAFVELWEIVAGSKVEFPNKSRGVAGFAKHVANVHVVAFQGDIETGKSLVLFVSNLLQVKFAVGVACKSTGQETVSRRGADRTCLLYTSDAADE